MTLAEAAFIAAFVAANLSAIPALTRRERRIERARVQATRAHRSVYRTSGTPNLACNGMWKGGVR